MEDLADRPLSRPWRLTVCLAALPGFGYNYVPDPGNTTETSIMQVNCANNNIATGPSAPKFYDQLDGVQTKVIGLGTDLAWQEISNKLGSYCNTPENGYAFETLYESVLSSGYLNGGQYTEIYPDVAFNSAGHFTGYFNQCAPDLTSALALLQAQPAPPNMCVYH